MDKRYINRRQRRRNKSRMGLLAFIMGMLLILAVPAAIFAVYLGTRDEAVQAMLPGWLPIPAGVTETAETSETINTLDTAVPVDALTVTPAEPAAPMPETAAAADETEAPYEIFEAAANPFGVFPFYISEHSDAYELFSAQRPDLDYEDVVWKVNVGLHLPFYSYIHTDYSEEPLLLSPFFRLPYGFTPAVLVQVYDGNNDLLATPATVQAFRNLRASANRAGLDLSVVSAFRTAQRQRVLFERQTRDGIVARPYHSEHQTGRALDLWGPATGLLDGDGVQSPEGLWVAQNAHHYGFIVRYTAENSHITDFISEPWHITYVGAEISMHMYENNIISLEEYVGRHPWIRPAQ